MVKKGGLNLIKYINLKEEYFRKRETEPKLLKLENFQDKCYQKYNVGIRRNVTFDVV
jgi:hypothetical protein